VIRFFLICSLFASTAMAECPFQQKDSEARYVPYVDFFPESDLAIKSAIKLVWKAFGEDCAPLEINYHESRCKMISSNEVFSGSCYVSSQNGYYFVTSDQISGAWVIWNRWD